MSINEIYVWLLENDPVVDSGNIRIVWINMASYCYFINAIDFDCVYQDKLKKILHKSIEFDVSVPDKRHSEVLELAKSIKSKKSFGIYLKGFKNAG